MIVFRSEDISQHMLKKLALLAIVVSMAAFAQITADSPFQVRYAANLNVADSIINITNTGVNGDLPYGPGVITPGVAPGNICVNVYAFSPDEQMVSCCSCLVTPNGLVSLSVYNDLRSNTLTGVTPNSMVIKLVSTLAGTGGSATSCTASAAALATATIVPGLAAWGTTAHVPGSAAVPAAVSPFQITETAFTPATLGAAEVTSLANRCTSIIGNGSTFGQCRSCSTGGRGASASSN